MMNNPKIICPNCGYDLNPPNSRKCEVCKESLFLSPQLTQVITNKSQAQTVTKQQIEEKPTKKKVQQVKQFQSNNWQKELLKPQNASGIVVAVVSSLLLMNQVFFNGNNARAKVDNTSQVESVNSGGIKLVKAISDVENVPTGTFPYSGDGYFASLLKAGLIREIVTAFPNFDSRYTVPTDNDPSYSTAIDMLLRREIDFVFNGRRLTDSEHNKAKLQGVTLTETEIAIDGIVFYTNLSSSVSKLTIAQLLAIFRGELTNWQELGGKDLPITPVILSKENVESLGFQVGDRANIQYANNHTLAVRKVINTPGAIGYASASLVQNQSLLKFLSLGQPSAVNPSVIDYVSPFMADGQPNKQAFEQGIYPITRELNLVSISYPISQAAGQAIANIILSEQGQDIVDQAGFVPIGN
ncbi:MAG: PstS family phosphate ABC transporter substrate-binding protein [Xenococcus sp. (in: cyanobacteria)]